MFNIGDIVKCNSGHNKGRVGVVVRHTTPYAGKDRMVVKFEEEEWETALWVYRFTHYNPPSKEELVLKKVKQMELRQKWKKRLV